MAPAERSIRFRINDLDTGTPSYTGGFGKTILSPFSNTEADCGVLTQAPSPVQPDASPEVLAFPVS